MGEDAMSGRTARGGRGRGAKTRRQLAPALLLSVVAHLGMAIIVILSLRPADAPRSQAIDLWLAPAVRAPPRRVAPPVLVAADKARPAAPSPSPSPSSSAASPTPIRGNAAPQGAPPPPTPGVSLAPGLRTALGCSHAGFLRLTAQEQARCAEQLGAGADRVASLSGLPADKRAAYAASLDYNPVLLSMPVKGCKPRMVTQQDGALGAQRTAVVAGISCVLRF